jgi:predicted unusual protein kinase regulating ubiquinone biosynthesis (AarF/ABC1/UbiB family)
MEYVPGMSISDARTLNTVGINTNELSYKVISVFMRMLLKSGHMHSDPHPGNLAIHPDGRIIVYDFGIMTIYEPVFRNALRDIFIGFVKRDVICVMELMLEHDIIYATDTKTSTLSGMSNYEYVSLHKLISYVFEYGQTLDMTQLVNSINTDPFIDMNNIPFVFDSKMVLLFRTMTSLEGICKGLNEEFSYDDVLVNIMSDFVDTSFLMDKALSDVSSILNFNLTGNKNETDVLHEYEKQLQTDALKNDFKKQQYAYISACAIAIFLLCL